MKIYTNDAIMQQIKKKNKIKKVVKFITYPILILIIIFIADVFFQKFILKKNNIEFFGYKPLLVITGCMEPTIKTGDMIIIKQVKVDEIKKGDVITYSIPNNKTSITHRVIEIIEKNDNVFYITKGDNNNAPDTDIISYDMVLGKVKYIFVGVGGKLQFLFTGTGLSLLVLVVLVHYSITNDIMTKTMAREEARKIYNYPKYKKQKT